MIKHIVMFRVKERAEDRSKAENIRMLKELLESLNKKIGGIRCLETGINLGSSGSASDVVLYSEFDDMNALENYRVHPEHIKAVELIEKICSERRVVDYEA